MLRAALILLALPLAACGGAKDESPGTTVSIKADGKDGEVSANASADGRVSIKAPGFEGSITLPQIKLDAKNFEMNGVHLYPGSAITAINIDATGEEGARQSNLDLRFASPAAPEAVRDWLKPRLTDAGYALETDGRGLKGTTEEGKPFRLELAPDGAGKSTGRITVIDND